jgi:hypothetical protein
LREIGSFCLPAAVILSILLCTLLTGCIGSAVPHPDLTPPDTSGDLCPAKEPAPLFNYPAGAAELPEDGLPGHYSAGDIIQPRADSPVYDPDTGFIVTGDSGRGEYLLSRVLRVKGTWYRTGDTPPGPVSHRDAETLLPHVAGYEHYESLGALA